MTAGMDDQSVAKRVLDHIANGTTDLGRDVWREPVANYRSSERLKSEIETVLRRTPTAFCPSAALPEVGSYVARERFGLVFVTQDEAGPGDDSLDGLSKLIAPDQRLFATAERDFDVNWKIFLESFIEGYHIKSTHPESFLPYGFDNLNVIDLFGRNSRVTYPFQRIKRLAKVPPAERRVDGLLTYVYHLFPNVLITVLSRHTNVVILEPLAVDRTRQFTYTLTNGGGDDPAALAEARRDAEFVGNTGALEDRAVVQAIQRGLASGANDHFTFGRYESAIVHFHRTLAGMLSEG